MSWLSELCKSISKWWKKNNSIGDVIHNNETFVHDGVVSLVDYGWDRKSDVEQLSKECAVRLLDDVLRPLPDMVEVMIGVMVKPRIASFFKSAFTLRDIHTKADAVIYIMGKLKALK